METVDFLSSMLTPLYGGFFGILYIILTKRVVDMRQKHKETIGAENLELVRAVRAHANFIEYVPIVLLLSYFLEIRIEASWLVHISLSSFLIGRIVHALAVSRVNENVKLRMVSMPLTFLPLSITSVCLVASYFIKF